MHRSKRHTPGDALELEVEQFLRSAGFRTQRNAGAARPRQTDIYAQADDFDILVEVKDRKRSVDINDVDALRSRLGRTAADIVGVIFTTSAITKGAVKAIEADRTREILIFVSDEIRLLRRGSSVSATSYARGAAPGLAHWWRRVMWTSNCRVVHLNFSIKGTVRTLRRPPRTQISSMRWKFRISVGE